MRAAKRDWESVSRKLTRADVRRIIALRYRDGLSSSAVAEVFGIDPSTVRDYAPGRLGKIDNAKLREAFEASGMTAGDVARSLGWTYVRASGRSAGVRCADSTRVRRILGLQDDVSHGARRGRRVLIDAETAALLAEAIGVAPWSVGCDEDMAHLAQAG